ncbi:myelin-associated glycoprotein-like [Heptranchias perlo]|uniref:myelin-associated glycoprotein-like n=1 Tax=Heptranchias perlo TaxID=212740 RepID=UPI00355A37F6
MPDSVSAVSGSCAQIPCTFHHSVSAPIPKGKWLKKGRDPRGIGDTLIYDWENPHGQPYNFGGRVELKGNVEKGQCSLLIKNIRKRDEGTYYFSVQIHSGWYVYTPATGRSEVFLSVSDKPQISGYRELTSGKAAGLTCSITHSCPNDKLQLRWIDYNGSRPLPWDTKDGTEIVNERSGSWRVSSVLTFTPSSALHGKSLGCSILLHGSLTSSPPILTLEIKYKPTIVSGPNCTSSENWIDCSCSVRANPPANITWGLSGTIITENRSDVKVFSWAVNSYLVESSLTLTHPTGSGIQISCVAANVHGDCISKYQLHSKGKLSWIHVALTGSTALIYIILTAAFIAEEIQMKKSREAIVSPEQIKYAATNSAI